MAAAQFAVNPPIRKFRTCRITIDGPVAYIELTRGAVAKIDAADVDLVSKFTWYLNPGKWRNYAVAQARTPDGKSIEIRLHRLLLGLGPGARVNHRDRDGLNNTRANLRIASQSQSAWHGRHRPNNTSGRKGVSWHKQRSMWQARICVNGVSRYLGLHATVEDAAAAYALASAEVAGEFSAVV